MSTLGPEISTFLGTGRKIVSLSLTVCNWVKCRENLDLIKTKSDSNSLEGRTVMGMSWWGVASFEGARGYFKKSPLGTAPVYLFDY